MSWFIPELEISAKHRKRREQRNQSVPMHSRMQQDSIRRRLTEPTATGTVETKGPQCPPISGVDLKVQRSVASAPLSTKRSCDSLLIPPSLQSPEEGECTDGPLAELTSSPNDGEIGLL